MFAHHAAPAIATDLCLTLVERGVRLPERLLVESDPLEVLRYTATTGRPELIRLIDDALRIAELTAVQGAEPTPYAREVILGAHRTSRPIAVVSNNSSDAVHAYLAARGLSAYVRVVVGRAYADPTRMKPDPTPVRAALSELAADPGECVMVGDSPGDIEAARAAGVVAIGYANKPGKRTRLAGADVLIDSMAELASALASPVEHV